VICFFELLLFPFWCLDAKGGEESIYLCRVSFYLDLSCRTLIYVWVGHVDLFLKLLWCACKNLIMACMNLILSML
jgi:hypothetical protein